MAAMSIRQADIVDMLRVLIGFDTVSRNSNLALIDWAEDRLLAHGATTRRFESDDGRKANLWATIGPDVAGGIVLSGHTDVVPVDGQPWDTDPFTLTERDGKLFGRGTSDMKCFSALALGFLPQMREAGLKRPIHFALSYDEEVGCSGCRSMVEYAGARDNRPAFVIVGEPTEWHLVDSHKGINVFQVEVMGLEAHSSQTHKGINAISYGARLITFLESIEKKLMDDGDPSGRFDPAFTSLHVGVLSGGTAQNIIPRRCRFTFEYRPLPGADVSAITAEIRDYAQTVLAAEMKAKAQAIGADPDEVGITITEGVRVPPLAPGDATQALGAMMRLAETNEAQAVSYGTEAGHFANQGLPTYVCGPGSIAQAHKPNEFIALSEIDAGIRFFERLIALASEPA